MAFDPDVLPVDLGGTRTDLPGGPRKGDPGRD